MELPAPVFAAIIASPLALIGVAFTIWNSRDLIKQQLEGAKESLDIQRKNAEELADIQHKYDIQQKDIEQLSSELFAADRESRTLRLTKYQMLWTLFQRFPKQPKSYPKYGDLARLADSIVDWYYTEGGILLPDATRDALFDLLDALRKVADDNPTRHKVDEPRYQELFKLFSGVRTILTSDIFSREEAKLAAHQRDRRERAQNKMQAARSALGLPKTSSQEASDGAATETLGELGRRLDRHEAAMLEALREIRTANQPEAITDGNQVGPWRFTRRGFGRHRTRGRGQPNIGADPHVVADGDHRDIERHEAEHDKGPSRGLNA